MCSSLQDRELRATWIAVSMRIPALIVMPKSVFDMKGGNHPRKQAVYARFSRVEMVELLARTNHPQKRAYVQYFSLPHPFHSDSSGLQWTPLDSY